MLPQFAILAWPHVIEHQTLLPVFCTYPCQYTPGVLYVSVTVYPGVLYMSVTVHLCTCPWRYTLCSVRVREVHYPSSVCVLDGTPVLCTCPWRYTPSVSVRVSVTVHSQCSVRVRDGTLSLYVLVTVHSQCSVRDRDGTLPVCTCPWRVGVTAVPPVSREHRPIRESNATLAGGLPVRKTTSCIIEINSNDLIKTSSLTILFYNEYKNNMYVNLFALQE